MSRFMWTSTVPQQSVITPFIPQINYAMPNVDSVDWKFIENLVSVRLNGNNDRQTLKRLRQTFLDATSFKTNDQRNVTKLFQALQILVEYQRNKTASLKENEILKH